MALPLFNVRSRSYWWWFRFWYASARTPKFQPLLRAEFANGCPYNQADFLLRAGYYNAAVCMARFGVESDLKRLALITPEWKRFRSTSIGGVTAFLVRQGAITSETRNLLNKFARKANRYVHETRVDKVAAIHVVSEADELRPSIAAATARLLEGGRYAA